MSHFDLTEKRHRVNVFKISGAYYFKQFFNDPELFRELKPFYEMQRYRFKMPIVGERNKVMKLIERKGYELSLTVPHDLSADKELAS